MAKSFTVFDATEAAVLGGGAEAHDVWPLITAGTVSTPRRYFLRNTGDQPLASCVLSIVAEPGNDGASMARIGIDTVALAAPYGLTGNVVAGSGVWAAAGTYVYVLTATNANGETRASPEIAVTLAATTERIALSWAPLGAAATGYRLYRQPVAGPFGATSLRAILTPGTVASYVDNGESTITGQPPVANTTAAGTFPALGTSPLAIGGFAVGQGRAIVVNRVVPAGVVQTAADRAFALRIEETA